MGQATDADAGARYAAIKALGFRGEVTFALARLRAAWENETEDLRIRLEALAGLARRVPEAWVPALAEFRKTLEPDMAMEAVFILAELPVPVGAEGLAGTRCRSEPARRTPCRGSLGVGDCLGTIGRSSSWIILMIRPMASPFIAWSPLDLNFQRPPLSMWRIESETANARPLLLLRS